MKVCDNWGVNYTPNNTGLSYTHLTSESNTELLNFQKWIIDKIKDMDNDKVIKLKVMIEPIIDLILKN